jgi:hypothetical protein
MFVYNNFSHNLQPEPLKYCDVKSCFKVLDTYSLFSHRFNKILTRDVALKSRYLLMYRNILATVQTQIITFTNDIKIRLCIVTASLDIRMNMSVNRTRDQAAILL